MRINLADHQVKQTGAIKLPRAGDSEVDSSVIELSSHSLTIQRWRYLDKISDFEQARELSSLSTIMMEANFPACPP